MIPLAKLRSMNAESKPVGAAMDSQDVAAAMDAGTSAGVKKSWLKRERAKKEAAVDAADAAADKNRLGTVRKPRKYDTEETSNALHDRIGSLLKTIDGNLLDNADNRWRRIDQDISFSLDIKSSKKDAEKCLKEIKEAMEDFMPKDMIENCQFDMRERGAVTAGWDNFHREGVMERRIVVHARNPSMMRERLDSVKSALERAEAAMKPVDEAFAAPDKHIALEGSNDFDLRLVAKDGAPTGGIEDIRAEEEYYRAKMAIASRRRMLYNTQQEHDRVLNAFTTGKYEA